MNTTFVLKRAVPLMALAMLVAACGTRHVSRGITPEGSASEVIFPDQSDIVLKEGTFPKLDHLRSIGPGVTKDQLYYLLGRPHFRETYVGVREWDYLFHFRKDSNQVVTCQYKVIFDQEHHGQSFHWAPASCVEVLNQEASPVAYVPEPEPEKRVVSLQADALFAFGRSGERDITDNGREEIQALGQQIMNVENVQVVGHTDYIGSDAANVSLSQRRAESVRQILIGAGVPADRIRAVGHGESQPVKQCEPTMARAELIACLAPNRRVEVELSGVATN